MTPFYFSFLSPFFSFLFGFALRFAAFCERQSSAETEPPADVSGAAPELAPRRRLLEEADAGADDVERRRLAEEVADAVERLSAEKAAAGRRIDELTDRLAELERLQVDRPFHHRAFRFFDVILH